VVDPEAVWLGVGLMQWSTLSRVARADAELSLLRRIVGVSGSGAGPSVSGGGLQSPAMVAPKTCTQGRWKVGSLGNVGQLNITPATIGVSHTMIGAQPGQGKMTGTIVEELSEPVVVSQPLIVRDASVMTLVDSPGSTVVIVEVTDKLGVVVAIGTGEPLMYSLELVYTEVTAWPGRRAMLFATIWEVLELAMEPPPDGGVTIDEFAETGWATLLDEVPLADDIPFEEVEVISVPSSVEEPVPVRIRAVLVIDTEEMPVERIEPERAESEVAFCPVLGCCVDKSEDVAKTGRSVAWFVEGTGRKKRWRGSRKGLKGCTEDVDEGSEVIGSIDVLVAVKDVELEKPVAFILIPGASDRNRLSVSESFVKRLKVDCFLGGSHDKRDEATDAMRNEGEDVGNGRD